MSAAAESLGKIQGAPDVKTPIVDVSPVNNVLEGNTATLETTGRIPVLRLPPFLRRSSQPKDAVSISDSRPTTVIDLTDMDSTLNTGNLGKNFGLNLTDSDVNNRHLPISIRSNTPIFGARNSGNTEQSFSVTSAPIPPVEADYIKPHLSPESQDAWRQTFISDVSHFNKQLTEYNRYLAHQAANAKNTDSRQNRFAIDTPEKAAAHTAAALATTDAEYAEAQKKLLELRNPSTTRDNTNSNPFMSLLNKVRLNRRQLIHKAASIGLAATTGATAVGGGYAVYSETLGAKSDTLKNISASPENSTIPLSKDVKQVTTSEGIDIAFDKWNVYVDKGPLTKYLDGKNDPDLQVHISISYPDLEVNNPSSLVIDLATLTNPTLENAELIENTIVLHGLPVTPDGIIDVRYLVRKSSDAENPISSVVYSVPLKSEEYDLLNTDSRIQVEDLTNMNSNTNKQLGLIDKDTHAMDALGVNAQVIVAKDKQKQDVLVSGQNIVAIVSSDNLISNPESERIAVYNRLVHEALKQMTNGSYRSPEALRRINDQLAIIQDNKIAYEGTLAPHEKNIKGLAPRDARPNIINFSFYDKTFDNSANIDNERTFKDISGIIESLLMTWEFVGEQEFLTKLAELDEPKQQEYIARIGLSTLNIVDSLNEQDGSISKLIPSYNTIRQTLSQYIG